MTDKLTTTWRKSTVSADNDQCVEILGTLDAVRDSKNPRPELRFKRPGRMSQLVQMLKDSTPPTCS